MAKLFILGAGGFGTALAVMSQANGHEVTMWSYREDEAAQLRTDRENRRLLPGVKIPEEIAIVTDFAALGEAELVLIAVPSSAVRSVSAQLHGRLAPGAVVVCVSKGFEPETLKRMDEVIAEELPENPCVILSGPSHAEEVAKGIPTTVVAACRDLDMAERVQMTLSGDTFRIYVTDDVIGAELGGALKNVIALAAGTADGLGCGDNTKAALITRGIAEIARLGIAMGGKQQTFYGLSGIGDLIVTCASMHSRNRRAGILIGKGYTMDEAMKEVQMVVEGVYSAKAGLLLAQKYGCDMPIVSQVNQVLFDGKSPKEALADLMMRDPRIESSDLPWEG